MADPGRAGGLFDRDLEKTPANYVPLTPLSFLNRAATIYPNKPAVIHGDRVFSYATFRERCRRLASALARRGVGKGDTVALLAGNIPATLEAHYAVPMLGAVLNALNIRLDAGTVAFCLDHGEAKVLIADCEFSDVTAQALETLDHPPLLVDIDDPVADYSQSGGRRLGEIEYEEFLASGDPDHVGTPPIDEWQAISLNYTSGTTGNPKGVVYHHRGAYLNAIGDVLAFGLTDRSVYLWTLPMFHCNGWSFTWGVTAAAATHVCLRRVEPAAVYRMIARHGVTHLCGAPIVLNMLAHAPDSAKVRFDHSVEVATGGAAPPSAVIAAMERNGFRVTHLYGLTETYGPSTICAWQEPWDGFSADERARMMARQGVTYPTFETLMVADPETMAELPRDGQTVGELMLRGNSVMKGYLKNPQATEAALRGGWFHTGDLATRHPDGYVEIKDRSKDIIISGGENISSLEVEEVLYRHPQVSEAAVVARPDEIWGESPCAFVTLKEGTHGVGADALIAWCRDNMAHFKVPRTVIFGPLPKTSTGKIQKYLLREQARTLSAAGAKVPAKGTNRQ
ncbi:acyl-CoA synthetase [Rhodospirillaceae bacterium SYSU D60014]|uniref:acyl-CoA synthetase n=1 Tax=Virgifigura deserti TaxID=2268457 RepID=UPI000E668C96